MTTQTAWLLLSQAAQQAADAFPHSRYSMSAESPFTNYTGGVAIAVLLVGFLVAVLLIGGILVVNLGMMSKRAEDRVGGRTPSDVGILKHSVWPEQPFVNDVLPAEEDDYVDTKEPPVPKKPAA